MKNPDTAPFPPLPPPPRRRPWLRAFKIGLVLLVLLAVVVLAAPIALSAGFVRQKVEREMAAALGVPVKIADYSLSWFNGVSLEGIEIDNPSGFPQDEKALRLKSARGECALLAALLRQRFDVSAIVQGLEVRVFQRADGQTNFGALFGVEVNAAREERPPPREGEERAPSTHPPSGVRLDDVRMDCTLIDGLIEIRHEQQGVLESLRDLTVGMRKEYGSSEVYLSVDAELVRPGGQPPGRLAVNVAADATLAKPVDATLDVSELDLARYRPLLAAFVPADQVTAFAGVVGGNTRALIDVQKKSVRLSGNLDVAQPHFAGPWLRGLDIAEKHWSLNPNVTVTMAAGGAPPAIEAEGLRIDLGFLKVEGLPPAQARALVGDKPALGAKFRLDLGALLKMGGPIPEELAGASGTVDGTLALAVVPEAFDPRVLAERFTDLFAAEAKLALDRLMWDGHELTGLSGNLALRDGKARVAAGASLGGGPVTLALDLDATKPAEWPAELKLQWKGGQAHAPAVKALRYAVPLLAGLDPSAAGADFRSLVDCELSFRGPLLKAPSDSTLAWLNTWRGQGDLSLKEGAFTPSGALQPLLQLAGEGAGKLTFKDLATKFVLSNGFVETSLLKLSQKAGDIGLRGRTSLDGKIEYALDLGPLLAQHKDGQRILQALGGKLPEAKLAGTLDEPELAMPDLTQLLQGAAQGTLKNAAEEALKKGLEGLIKKKR